MIMARYERKSKNFEGSQNRDSRDRRRTNDGSRSRDFEDRPKSRGYSDRSSSRGYSDRSRGSSRGEVKMTKVICSLCGKECEVPFKPTTNKPVYCDDCFAKQNKRSSGREAGNSSRKDFDIINKKLDKIMKALKIE